MDARCPKTVKKVVRPENNVNKFKNKFKLKEFKIFSENLLQNRAFCGILYTPNQFLLRCAGGGESNRFCK